MRLPEVYVKGNNVRQYSPTPFTRKYTQQLQLTPLASQIKYLRVPDEIIDQVTEQQKNQQGGGFRGGRGGHQSRGDHGGHGGRGGGDRGRGRGGRGRGRGRGQ